MSKQPIESFIVQAGQGYHCLVIVRLQQGPPCTVIRVFQSTSWYPSVPEPSLGSAESLVEYFAVSGSNEGRLSFIFL